MDLSPVDIEALAELCVELATGAGAVAMHGRGEHFRIMTKSTATDLVTEIDRRVERWLVDRIHAARPGAGVLGEEGAAEAGSSSVRWLLDPIDGTVNFALGHPHYAVSVAVEVDGVVVAGCVRCPEEGETYRAHRGGGAFLGDRRLSGPRAVDLARAVIGTGFGYAVAERARQGRIVAEVLPQVGDIRRFGAASLDLCAVAAGRLDGYFESGLNPWDWAAGSLVAEEAGCVVTGEGGGEASSALIVAAGPELAPELAGLLAQLGAARG